MRRSRDILENLIVLVCFFLVLSLAYFPAFVHEYIQYDDYLIFDKKIEVNVYILQGRFLNLFLSSALFPFIKSVHDLCIIRLVTVFFLSSSGLLIYLWLRGFFVDKTRAFLLSALLFTLPPSQIIVSNAVSINIAVALLVSSGAALLARRAYFSQLTCGRWLNPYFFASFFLMLAVLFIYQPAAMFYWVLVGLLILFGEVIVRNASVTNTPPQNRKNDLICYLFFLGLTAMGVYVIILKLLRIWCPLPPVTDSIYYAYVFIKDYIPRMKEFVEGPLCNALNLWNIFPKTSCMAWTIVFIMAAWIMMVARNFNSMQGGRQRGFYILRMLAIVLLWLSLVLLSFAPNLVAVLWSPWYRCCSALASIIAILVIWAISEWFLFFKLRRRYAMVILLSAGLMWGMFKAYHNVLYYKVIPCGLELKYLKNCLRSADLSAYNKILVVFPQDHPFLFPSEKYHEFGGLATESWWIIPLTFPVVLNEIGIKSYFYTREDHAGLRIKLPRPEGGITYYDYEFQRPVKEIDYPLKDPLTLVIDMRNISSTPGYQEYLAQLSRIWLNEKKERGNLAY